MYVNRTNGFGTVIDVPREGTAPLLAKVLGITALGFFVTAIGVATAPAWSMLPGFIAVLALVFAINRARTNNPGLAMGLFMLLAFAMGWEIGPLLHRYIALLGPGIVFEAAVTTGLGMTAMGCVAYLFSIDYRRLSGIAMAGLLLLILAGVVSMFFHFLSPNTYSWMALAIFTALTVADFARIRAGGDGMGAVSLALGIYLDAINIFLILLQLFGGRSRRD